MLLDSLYGGFGMLLVQLAVWQSCGVRYCVGALRFVFLQLLFAFVCTGVRSHAFSSQAVFDVNSNPGICAMGAFALYLCLFILIMF